jgi:hypothetical protein
MLLALLASMTLIVMHTDLDISSLSFFSTPLLYAAVVGFCNLKKKKKLDIYALSAYIVILQLSSYNSVIDQTLFLLPLDTLLSHQREVLEELGPF